MTSQKEQIILEALDTTRDFAKRQTLLKCLWKLRREQEADEPHNCE